MSVVLLPEVHPKRAPMLSREKAAAYLSELGFSISKDRLARLAMTGDGPEYIIWGNRAVYAPDTLLEWAGKRGGKPKTHTSELAG